MKPLSTMSSVRPRTCRPASLSRFDVALALLLTLGSATADEKLDHTLSPVATPVEAPAFRLKDMDGSEMALADFRGKVVLLNFWATWCPPCRREMPSMERVHQELNAGPFSVIAINEYESPDHVFAYVSQLSTDPTFPILFDPDSAVSELYKVRGLPTTYLIDKHGRIRYRAIGGREYDHPEVLGTIRALMAED